MALLALRTSVKANFSVRGSYVGIFSLFSDRDLAIREGGQYSSSTTGHDFARFPRSRKRVLITGKFPIHILYKKLQELFSVTVW